MFKLLCFMDYFKFEEIIFLEDLFLKFESIIIRFRLIITWGNWPILT